LGVHVAAIGLLSSHGSHGREIAQVASAQDAELIVIESEREDGLAHVREDQRENGHTHGQQAARAGSGQFAARATGHADAVRVGGSMRIAMGLAETASSDDGEDGAGRQDEGGGEAQAAHGEGAASAGHAPLLVAGGCQSYFPAKAHAARGLVTVAVEVGANGRADGARVVAEEPPREGFGAAAAGCALQALRFSPAVDRSGAAIRGMSTLQLRFARRSL
jgi:hypothetical protein